MAASASSGSSAKAELRLILRSKRQELTSKEVEAKSRAITSRIISAVDWKSVRAVHCYEALPKEKEVDTSILQDWMRRRGIYIKTPGRELTLEEMTYHFDIIFVPMLGFDSSLHRLGYGSGFYDRLLDAQPKSLSIGLSYDACLLEPALPVEPHDRPLNIICTETTTHLRKLPS